MLDYFDFLWYNLTKQGGINMKLYSFRIQNYKSIKDSGVCYVEKNITIFAGKNGSGKSTLIKTIMGLKSQDER